MEEFEKLKNKFKNSNKYMLTLDYEEIKRLIEITENLIARNKKIEKSLYDNIGNIVNLSMLLFENSVKPKDVSMYVEECQVLLNTLNKYYIQKSKVREKIEENKWAMEHYDCDEADYKQSQAVGAWNVLMKLLQEGDK